jgi:hypothetical protein
MKFNNDGKIDALTVASVDTRPFFKAVSEAAKTAGQGTSAQK